MNAPNHLSLAIVTTLILVAHLWAIQIAAAGPAVAVWLQWRGGSGDRSILVEAGRRLARHSLIALVVGMTLGLGLYWMASAIGVRDYRGVIARFESRIWWGGWELLFSLLLMIAYVAAWEWAQATGWRRMVHRTLPILSATNLLYHFPLLFTVMVDGLATQFEAPVEPLTSKEFRQLVAAPRVIANALHFIFAAFAIVAAWLLLLAKRVTSHEDGSREVMQEAAGLAVAALAVQMLTGFWLLVAIAPEAQMQITGGDLVETSLLASGVLAGFAGLGGAAQIAIGDLESARPRRTALLIFLATLLMIALSSRQSGLTTLPATTALPKAVVTFPPHPGNNHAADLARGLEWVARSR